MTVSRSDRQYTMRKAMLLSNLCGFLLGLITAIVALLPSGRQVGDGQVL